MPATNMPPVLLAMPPDMRYRHHRFSARIRHDLKQLTPDNWHGPFYIMKEYTIVAAWTLATIWFSWWLYPLAVLLIGAHQRGISTILHDCAHGVLCRNRRLNFLLGTLPTAWPIFQRHLAYRDSHVLTHHPYLGRPDKDPDLAFFIVEHVFDPMPDSEYLRRNILLPALGSKTWAYLGYLVRNRYLSMVMRVRGAERNSAESSSETAERRKHGSGAAFDRVGFGVFWTLVTGAAVLTNTWALLLLFWIIPYLTSFHILGWFIEMSEHCSSTEGQCVNLFMARNRRSRHLEKWLTGVNNDHYHLDHHLDPTTPFWRLPAAHLIRMRDEDYARHCVSTGGLFQRGSDGAPSIVSLLRRQNAVRWQAAQLRRA